MSQETEEYTRFPDRQIWQEALDAAPKSGWIKTRNLGGSRTSKYMPLTVQQALADIFFLEFDVIEIKWKIVANEIVTTVKVSILPSYPNSNYRIICGIGSKPVQMRSGALASKFPRSKIINALEYCAPASKSSALSNALQQFANVFGKNLGRKVSDGFNLKNKKKKNKNKKK